MWGSSVAAGWGSYSSAAAKANTYFSEIHYRHSGTEEANTDVLTRQKKSAATSANWNVDFHWHLTSHCIPAGSGIPPLKQGLQAVTQAGNATHSKTIPSNGHLQQIQWCLPGMPAENTMVLYTHTHTATQLVPKEFIASFPFSVFWYIQNNNLYIKQNRGHRLGRRL